MIRLSSTASKVGGSYRCHAVGVDVHPVCGWLSAKDDGPGGDAFVRLRDSALDTLIRSR